jgi:hypothetical protein
MGDEKRVILMGLAIDLLVLGPMLVVYALTSAGLFVELTGAELQVFWIVVAIGMLFWAIVLMEALGRTGLLRRMAMWSGIIVKCDDDANSSEVP